MRIVLRVSVAFVLLFVLVLGLQQIAMESGEVVVLTTVDQAGVPQNTRLWVVDRDGQQWLRAGVKQSDWFVRMQANNLIKLERDGLTRTYLALPDPSVYTQINDLMSEKYGWADSYIGFLFGRDASVPINLQEAPGELR
ncbi:MAG: hypothetical protein O7B25_01920 [Gammaproteobacteria bacterium]|nr:hypothetical protein [Gammaproteobacteria bacterium]